MPGSTKLIIVKAFLEESKQKEKGRARERERESGREGERMKGGQTEAHKNTKLGFRWKGKEVI